MKLDSNVFLQEATYIYIYFGIFYFSSIDEIITFVDGRCKNMKY
jgi:hypothetical protein